MKYLILIASCLVLFTPMGRAQVEQWDTYIAKYGNKPGSVLVDMGLISAAPDRRFPYLVITGPIAGKCDGRGMPGKEELTVLEDILDGTSSFLTGVTTKVLAGTFTYDCARVNYYYVKDTSAIRNALRRMYDRNYKNYQYAINIKYDPEWKTYLSFLYPDEATRNWMANNKVITQMLRDGDSLAKPRDINFELYFHSDSERVAFEGFATKNDYRITKRTETNKAPVLFAIVVSRNSPVELDAVNKMTAALKEEAKKHNGYFSGWTAPNYDK